MLENVDSSELLRQKRGSRAGAGEDIGCCEIGSGEVGRAEEGRGEAGRAESGRAETLSSPGDDCAMELDAPEPGADPESFYISNKYPCAIENVGDSVRRTVIGACPETPPIGSPRVSKPLAYRILHLRCFLPGSAAPPPPPRLICVHPPASAC